MPSDKVNKSLNNTLVHKSQLKLPIEESIKNWAKITFHQRNYLKVVDMETDSKDGKQNSPNEKTLTDDSELRRYEEQINKANHLKFPPQLFCNKSKQLNHQILGNPRTPATHLLKVPQGLFFFPRILPRMTPFSLFLSV